MKRDRTREIEKQRKWRLDNPEKYREKYRSSNIKQRDKNREISLRKNFGISIDEYNIMFTEQHGKCAICERHQSVFKRALAVDHNHTTGTIRGLLCHSCNIALGCVRDDIDVLNRMIVYLSSSEEI